MLNLKFTARGIADLEEEINDSIYEILKSPKLSNMALIISKGTLVEKDEAFRKIDEYLSNGKSTEDLYIDLMEALQKDGFLSKRMNLSEMRKDLEETIEKKKK